MNAPTKKEYKQALVIVNRYEASEHGADYFKKLTKDTLISDLDVLCWDLSKIFWNLKRLINNDWITFEKFQLLSTKLQQEYYTKYNITKEMERAENLWPGNIGMKKYTFKEKRYEKNAKIGDLSNLTERDIAATSGIGEKRLNLIKSLCRHTGVKLNKRFINETNNQTP